MALENKIKTSMALEIFFLERAAEKPSHRITSMISAEQARQLKVGRILSIIEQKIIDATEVLQSHVYIKKGDLLFELPQEVLYALEGLGYIVKSSESDHMISWRDTGKEQ
jgi:hypothetical protein